MSFKINILSVFVVLVLNVTTSLISADEPTGITPASKQEKLMNLAIDRLRAYLMGDSKAFFENVNIPDGSRKDISPLIDSQVTTMGAKFEISPSRQDGVWQVEYTVDIQRGENRKTKIHSYIECVFIEDKWSIVGMGY